MVLFVGWEDEVIENFAAGNGRVVAQERVDQPGAIFEVANPLDFDLLPPPEATYPPSEGAGS